jgi:uncharacterized protein YjbJ (UPF0337 family)
MGEGRWCGSKNKEVFMGVGDKAEDLTGKVKEGLGDAADNRDLEAEGQAEQSEADAERAGDDVADAQWEVDEHIQIDDKR